MDGWVQSRQLHVIDVQSDSGNNTTMSDCRRGKSRLIYHVLRKGAPPMRATNPCKVTLYRVIAMLRMTVKRFLRAFDIHVAYRIMSINININTDVILYAMSNAQNQGTHT